MSCSYCNDCRGADRNSTPRAHTARALSTAMAQHWSSTSYPREVKLAWLDSSSLRSVFEVVTGKPASGCDLELMHRIAQLRLRGTIEYRHAWFYAARIINRARGRTQCLPSNLWRRATESALQLLLRLSQGLSGDLFMGLHLAQAFAYALPGPIQTMSNSSLTALPGLPRDAPSARPLVANSSIMRGSVSPSLAGSRPSVPPTTAYGLQSRSMGRSQLGFGSASAIEGSQTAGSPAGSTGSASASQQGPGQPRPPRPPQGPVNPAYRNPIGRPRGRRYRDEDKPEQGGICDYTDEDWSMDNNEDDSPEFKECLSARNQGDVSQPQCPPPGLGYKRSQCASYVPPSPHELEEIAGAMSAEFRCDNYACFPRSSGETAICVPYITVARFRRRGTTRWPDGKNITKCLCRCIRTEERDNRQVNVLQVAIGIALEVAVTAALLAATAGTGGVILTMTRTAARAAI